MYFFLNLELESFEVNNLTIDRAVKVHCDKALETIKKELENMENKKVWRFINIDDLTWDQKKNIIPSKMFLKEKSNGVLKARLVGNGNLQEWIESNKKYSQTASIEAMLTCLILQARSNAKITNLDIGSAYLNAKLEDDVLMKLNGSITNI